MVDPRIEKLASVLVHYSLQIRRNDLFRIAGPSLATPLIRAVYAEAQDAEMSLVEYEDFVFTAGLLHESDPVAAWERVRAEQARVAAALGRCATLAFHGPDVDLTVSVAGRTWINAAGEKNFPDG